MGQVPKVPAVLIRTTVNVIEAPIKREVHLTSGCYTLADTNCGGCRALLGWRYLTAHEKVTCKRRIPIQSHTRVS